MRKRGFGVNSRRADNCRSMRKFAISLVLALSMIVTMMPAMAFAEENQGGQEANQKQQTQQQDQNQEQQNEQPVEPANTAITGFKAKAAKKSRYVMSVTVKVTNPKGRDIVLEQYISGKWRKKGVFETSDQKPQDQSQPQNAQSQQQTQEQDAQNQSQQQNAQAQETVQDDVQSVRVIFPNTWWKKEKTKWRLRVDANDQAKGCTTKVMTLKTKRFYQNPKKYVQIKNKISKHGKHYYTYPVKVNNASTRKDHVNAMIKAAKKYLGDPYVVCRSGKPGRGVDCSGLVMQACYAAGVDLWPSNPYRHRFPKYEYESTRIAKMKNLKTVPYSKIKRGDLVFFSKNGTVMHIGIYIGGGKMIHSWPGRVQISRAKNSRFGHLSKVKRVFISK